MTVCLTGGDMREAKREIIKFAKGVVVQWNIKLYN